MSLVPDRVWSTLVLATGSQTLKRTQKRRRGVSSRIRPPLLEFLEHRHLLAAWSDTASEHSLSDVSNPTTAPTCPGEHSTVPAPAFHSFPLDLNLDGRFDTADLTLAFQTRATVINDSSVARVDQTVAQVIEV